MGSAKYSFVFPIAVLLCLIASGGATSFAQTYHLVDLGTLPGRTDSTAAAINNSGQIVGTSYNFIPNYFNYPFGFVARHAFLYSGGAMTDLGTIGGDYQDSIASAISSSGHVVGYSLNGFGFAQSFEYSGGTLNPSGLSAATGINSNGQIVGSTGDGFGAIYDHGNITELQTAVDGSLPGYYSYANAINNPGQVAGSASVQGQSYAHAFLYSNGTMSDLGTLGGQSSGANALNDKGQVVGASAIGPPDNTGTAIGHAFLATNGAMIDLGTFAGDDDSNAVGINNNGQIIGTSYHSGTANFHPFLFSDGTMHDLNDLLDSSGAGWFIESVTGINDSGEIVGQGITPDGNSRAILLTPVPEPCTLTLLALGVVGLIVARRRR